MSTLRISGMVFQGVFVGSLSMQDTEIERRPYHENCNCELHRSKGGACSNACPQRNISFAKKQSWTDASLCMSAATSKVSSHPGSTSGGNKEVVHRVQTLSQRKYTEVTEAC